MDYLNPVFGQSENNQLEIVIIAIRISKQRYQISTESTMRKGIVRANIHAGCQSRLFPSRDCFQEKISSIFAKRLLIGNENKFPICYVFERWCQSRCRDQDL